MQWLSGLYYADFISFYSPTQLCGGGTTKSNSNELPISVPLSFLISMKKNGSGKELRKIKKFVFPPPHSWLGHLWSLKANKDANQPLRLSVIPIKYQRLDIFAQPHFDLHISALLHWLFLQVMLGFFPCSERLLHRSSYLLDFGRSSCRP